ncbi:MAG: hypothetical protein AB4040_02405 [Synechococcus sp.]
MKDLLLPVQELTRDRKDVMFSLFNKHFSGVKRDEFEADLMAKQWVILLEDSDLGLLQGFTTLRFDSLKFNQEKITTLYSGDTIVDPSAWSQSRLVQAWLAAVLRLCQQYDGQRLYWLLISSGYRTYRFLPTFWKVFYPCCTAETPTYEGDLMQYLGRTYFGDRYDETAGVVRFPHAYVLREELQEIAPGRLQNRHIRFFTERNPGHTQGDNLVCLTEISRENLTRAGQRMLPTQLVTNQLESHRLPVGA